jgi:hypothetical protein
VGTQEFVTFLIPRAGVGVGDSRVREIEAVGGRAFELRNASGNYQLRTPADDVAADGVVPDNSAQDEAIYDLVLIGDSGLVESPLLVSDFVWTWARFAGDTGELIELVLIDGSRLHYAGQELVRATERIGYLSARRRHRAAGEEWELESDPRTQEFSFTPPAIKSRDIIDGRGDSDDAAATLSCHGL